MTSHTADAPDPGDPIVYTSDESWLEKALDHYKNKRTFRLIDDAALGLNVKDAESGVSLIRAAKKKAGIPWKNIAAALAGLGISAAGIWIIWLAVLDPEPTSKLGLLIAGGFLLALTGSLGTLAALGVRVTVKKEGNNLTVRPEADGDDRSK